MIDIGKIVTLDNGEEYLLLEELIYLGSKYVYGLKTVEDDEITDESMLFVVVIEDDGEYLAPIENIEEYKALMKLFKDKVAKKINNIPSEEEVTE